jgi:hypothetical protein
MGAQASVYASNLNYAAFGQPLSYQYGPAMSRVLNYNSRLQIQSYTDQSYNSTTNTTTPLLSATLNWYDAYNHNNGNLQGVTYTHSGSGFPTPATFSDTFTDDNVNRLSSATDVLVATGAREWLQNYGFDQIWQYVGVVVRGDHAAREYTRALNLVQQQSDCRRHLRSGGQPDFCQRQHADLRCGRARGDERFQRHRDVCIRRQKQAGWEIESD